LPVINPIALNPTPASVLFAGEYSDVPRKFQPAICRLTVPVLTPWAIFRQLPAERPGLPLPLRSV
jgi:hypothetical protein